MASSKIKLEGVEETLKAIDALSLKMQEKVILNAVRAGGRSLVKEIKSRTYSTGLKRVTGELADSVVLKTVAKRKRSGPELVKIGFKKPTSRRVHLHEYGTSRTKATPFVRPALDAKGAAAGELIVKKMADGLKRIAKQAAKKNKSIIKK